MKYKYLIIYFSVFFCGCSSTRNLSEHSITSKKVLIEFNSENTVIELKGLIEINLDSGYINLYGPLGISALKILAAGDSIYVADLINKKLYTVYYKGLTKSFFNLLNGQYYENEKELLFRILKFLNGQENSKVFDIKKDNIAYSYRKTLKKEVILIYHSFGSDTKSLKLTSIVNHNKNTSFFDRKRYTNFEKLNIDLQ